MTGAGPRSCASCGVESCDMHQRHGKMAGERPPGWTAWLLDDCWPEFASYLDASARADDQILAPGIAARAHFSRYCWPRPANAPAPAHGGTLATLRRHIAMQRVATAPGQVRQRAYLDSDRRLATALARKVDYRARHIIVAQTWLPWLDESGLLGGRSYDVLMSRFPLADIHRLLDRAAEQFDGPPDPTVRDFRAPRALVEREMALLTQARRIITPHHGIAALFPMQALRLGWHRPPAKAQRQRGDAVAFLGPALARQRPDLARRFAQASGRPLILLGAGSATSPLWHGLDVTQRSLGAGWLDGIGTIVHPATMTSQPRRLLEALAHGVEIVATPECGLDPADYRPL